MFQNVDWILNFHERETSGRYPLGYDNVQFRKRSQKNIYGATKQTTPSFPKLFMLFQLENNYGNVFRGILHGVCNYWGWGQVIGSSISDSLRNRGKCSYGEKL